MPISKTPKEQLTHLLRKVILATLKKGEYNVTLKAIELLGKEEGLFQNQKTLQPNSLSDYSTQTLESLLREINDQQKLTAVK